MISGEKIGKYIANPFLIDANDLPDLLELAKKYPYCSSLQLLQLKGLALSNDLSFEDQLKVTAIHVPDREHLYTLIHSGEVQEKVTSKTEDKTETIEEESTLIEETIIGVSATIKEMPIEKNPLETPEPKLSEEEQEVEMIAPAIDELEIDILNKAIDIAFVESEISEEEVIAGIQKEIITPTQKEVWEKEKTIEEKKELPIETKPLESEIRETNILQGELSFVQWLRLKQEKSRETETPEEPAKMASLGKRVPEPKEKIAPQTKTEKNDVDALLDKFIAEEPTISRPVKDFYNPVKNAKESVQESDDLVTETLAKIHVMQKNYSKAISAYEKLILLYPEKKAFFASRIEKIQEETKKK